MENKKAIAIIDKILKNLNETGINTDTLIDDIKELRTYTIELEIPLVVKTLRFTYEHIEANDSFLIPIPEDSPIEDESEIIEEEETSLNPVESLSYLIALVRNLSNSANILDLQYYKKALMAF